MKTYIDNSFPWFDLYDEGVPAANNVTRDHVLANVKSLSTLLDERKASQHKTDACSYCAAAGMYEIQPCKHMLCEDCANGLPEKECPQLCRSVTGRKLVVLPESEAGWNSRSYEEHVVVLSRCAERGLVGSFKLPQDDVSVLSSDSETTKV